ncbi:9272_t:CDS:1 [Paraglomus brasilianum]|uniref:9272_t:CDS:1 n=1 Tax=Paraglomus brasilianum TaxID=144538 RepID=A0A9N8VPV6_9GLOM|nr:9272_t:CDS:1 [Paraglomus brasilianum]
MSPSIRRATWILLFLTALALYLVSVSYLSQSIIQQPEASSELTDDEDFFDDYDENEDEERYLTYLPHSGFHNQRIALENALFLAWATNRTLIMPPIVLGSRIPYQPFPRLFSLLSSLNPEKKQALPDCSNLVGAHLASCLKTYRKLFFTFLQWDELMDLSAARGKVRIINRYDFNITHLYEKLDFTEEDVYVLEDQVLYSFQICDNPNPSVRSDKFKDRVSLTSIKKRPQKLLHFSSLFSSSRILAELPENREILDLIRRNMVISHPVLTKVVDKIVVELGGQGSYVGVHIRVGDGFFKKQLASTVAAMTDKLLREYGPASSSAEGDDSVQTISEKQEFKENSNLSSCFSQNSNYPVLYLATDSAQAEEDLAGILSAFPCVFMLSDFNSYLDEVKQVVNPIDHVNLQEFFVPLIDLMVVAKGGRFIGTHRSTFSNYAKRLHEVWVGDDADGFS